MNRADVYQENGYKNRDDYLNSLAEDYGVPIDAVLALADVLGPDEDFDGLVSNLEDAMYGGWFDGTDEEEYDGQMADTERGGAHPCTVQGGNADRAD